MKGAWPGIFGLVWQKPNSQRSGLYYNKMLNAGLSFKWYTKLDYTAHFDACLVPPLLRGAVGHLVLV